jgi:hypothetical protein
VPGPAFGFQVTQSALEAGCKHEEQEPEYAAQEYELHEGIVCEQPLRTQIETKTGGHTEQQEADGSSVMVVRKVPGRQKFRSAGVQKIG